MLAIFIALLLKLLPLFLIIILGFISGKYLKVARESIASLLIYIVVPVVTFKGVFETDINLETLTLPILYFIHGAVLAASFYKIGQKVFKSQEKASLLSLCSSLANTGYFGIPFMMILFGEEVLGTVVLLILGLSIHENSIGFLIAAKGKHGWKEALAKTFRLPTIYTSIAGLLANKFYNHIYLLDASPELRAYCDPILESLLVMMDKFVGALTLLGMLMIGLGLAAIDKVKFDWKFISLSFIAKFLIFPGIALTLIFISRYFYTLYDEQTLAIIFYMSLVPIGANSITLATQLGYETDTPSLTVMLSTFFALFFIPLMWIFANFQLGF